MKPYRVYNVLTDALIGDYNTHTEAAESHRGQPITIIYRPSRRKKK